MKAISHTARALIASLVAVVNTGWSVVTIYIALLAESGGKKPELLTASLLLWLLTEILVTVVMAIRFAPAADRPLARPRAELSLLLALLFRPAVELTFTFFDTGWAGIVASALIMIALCHALRRQYRAAR